jgi:hypothetical protein
MQAVLYHHGFPQQRNLLTLERREWLASLDLPAAGSEQLTIALHMIDAIDLQIVPLDEALRTYARKQPGCRALVDQIYGVGTLTGVTILAELGDPAGFTTHVTLSATPGWTSPCTSQTLTALRGISHAKDHPHCAGRSTKQRWSPAHEPPAPIASTTSRPRTGSAGTAHASRSPESSSNAATTSCANSVTKRSSRSPPDPPSDGKPDLDATARLITEPQERREVFQQILDGLNDPSITLPVEFPPLEEWVKFSPAIEVTFDDFAP